MTDQDGSAGTAEMDENLSPEDDLKAKLKEAIQVAVEDVGPLRKKVTITVPRDTIDEQLNEQFDELRQDANVPGFRRGRAPQKLLEKRFGREVGEQVGSSLVGNSYMAAVDKESIDTLGDPLVFVTLKEKRTDDGIEKEVEVEKLVTVDQAIEHLKLPKDGDFSFACEVEVKPSFELPNLEKIPVEKLKLEIIEKDVDSEIKRIMMLRGTFRPVEDGVVEADDIIVGTMTLTVEGKIIKSEENVELAARDQSYGGTILDGFGEAVLGKKIGDAPSIEIVIPEDYDEVQVRGKNATFTVEILDIKRLDVPELDDAFVTNMGFDTQDEFRSFVKEQMETRLASELHAAMHEQISQYLLSKTEMELPDKTSQRMAERMVAQQMMDMYRRGMADAEIAKQVDALQTQAAERAAEELKRFFIMEKVSEDREIHISEEEINTAIAEIAQRRNLRFDRVRDEIISTNNLQSLYVRLRDEKILEILLADADVTEKDAPTPAPEKDAETKNEKD